MEIKEKLAGLRTEIKGLASKESITEDEAKELEAKMAQAGRLDLQVKALDVGESDNGSEDPVKAEEVEAMVKAYLEKQPALNANKAGWSVTVTGDEADRNLKGNPYKSFGEFMMAVKDEGLGLPVDQRLLPLKSKFADDEGGFSLTGAMGDTFVKNVHRSAYLKAVTGLSEGIAADGGFLVDTDRAPGLLARDYEIGNLLLRAAMHKCSAGSNSMTWRAEAETSRATGSRRGGVRGYWVEEAGTKTASQPEFRKMELKLKKVVALVYATDELLEDAALLESYLMRVYPEELRFLVEDSMINGTGAGMPLGILASACLVSVAKETGQAATTLVSQNIIKMWARMWARSRRSSVWLINQDVEPQMYQFTLSVGTGGSVVYMPPGGLSAAPYGTLFGRPVIPVEYCPTLGQVGDIILADLSEYYMLEKGSGIQSASSIHVRFVYDETVFRFVYRVDGQPSWAAPLTPFKGAANTQSPFVVLAIRE